jgi:mannose-6-phosphate isomerase
VTVLQRRASVHLLRNEIRPYAWGSVTALPEFLGTDPTGQPAAELWMGAHPGAPSRLADAAGTLAGLVAAEPERTLGRAVARRFDKTLPFMLKVLAVERPLSLQAHPDTAQAAAGYAEEEARGVPLGAAERNYKDPNHKPEQICALTTFTGMCGFRPVRESAALLAELDAPSMSGYAERLVAEGGLRELVTAVLTMPDAAIADLLADAIPAFERVAAQDGPWQDAASWLGALAREYPRDRGVVVAMLMNLVHLTPGESMFLSAGVPHVYLSGTAVEILASSDNVLRCGLTNKHVDVPELMRVLRVEQTPAAVRPPEPVQPGVEKYPSGVADFALYRIRPVDEGTELPAGAPRIVLCAAGHVELRDADGTVLVALGRGGSAFVPADASVVAHAVSEGSEAFVATTNL